MYLAIDIGGTKTLLGVFNDKGELGQTHKFPTDKNYQQFLLDLAKSVEKLSTKSFKAVGVAVPGRLDRKAGVGIAFGNLPWKQVPIRDDIAKIVHTKVLIENDSKLAGLSEARLVQDTYQKVLYVTISTGISDALVIHGKLDQSLIDSEPGQMLLEHQGQLKRWEDFASGRAIHEQFGKQVSDINDVASWYIISRNIALGLGDLVATINPDVIIIGGGVGAHLDKFKSRLEEDLKLFANDLFTVPPIRQAARAGQAVIYGAYEFVRDHD